MAIELTSANFDEHALVKNKPVVVDFWAEWCGPCRLIGPILDMLSVEYEGKAVITKVNVDDNNDLTTKYKIINIPTMLFLKNGEVVDKIIGATNRNAIVEKINSLL